MSCCPAINCSNRDVKMTRDRGITFHRFPYSKPALLKRWIVNVKLKQTDASGHAWRPGRIIKLCSAHFTPDCFDRTGQTVRLRCDAVPTIFFNFPEQHLQKCIEPSSAKGSKEMFWSMFLSIKAVTTRTTKSSTKVSSPSEPSELSSTSLNSTTAKGVRLVEHSYFTPQSPRKLKKSSYPCKQLSPAFTSDIKKNCKLCYSQDKIQRKIRTKCKTCDTYLCFNGQRNCLSVFHNVD